MMSSEIPSTEGIISGIPEKLTRETKVPVYPMGLMAVKIPLFTDADRFMDWTTAFVSQANGDDIASDFNLNSWSIVADSVVDRVADKLRLNVDIPDGNDAAFFTWMNTLTSQQLDDMFKTYRTRQVDKQSMIEVVAYAKVALFSSALALAVLKSKVRTWIGQVNFDLEELIRYKTDKPDTFSAKLYQDAFGVISGGDLDLIRHTIVIIEKWRLFLPAEAYHMADKIIGSMDLPYILDDQQTEIRSQHMDLLLFDPNNSTDPKMTNTEDTNMENMLKSHSWFFNNLKLITQFIQYRDEGEYNAFLDAYGTQEMTLEWLISWPKLEVPWWLYVAEVNTNIGVYYWNTRDLSADAMMTNDIFRREASPGTDAANYLEIVQVNGFTDDQIKQAFFFGMYLAYGLVSNNFDGGAQTELNSLTNGLFYFQAIETKDNKGNVVEVKGIAAPTLDGSELTEDSIYGWFNRVDEAPFSNPFTPATYTVANIADPASALSPLTVSGANISRVTTIAELFDRMLPRTRIEQIEIDREYFIPSIFDFQNPVNITEADKPPTRKSTLDSSTYSSSDDINELEMYIKDLEAEKSYHHAKENKKEVASRETTIKRVRDRIELVRKDNKEKENKPPEGNPANTNH